MEWLSGQLRPVLAAVTALDTRSVRGRFGPRQRGARRSAGMLHLLAWLAMLAGSGASASGLPKDCRLEAGTAYTVARVIDGETIVVDDGREVRLAGILAPRAGDIGAATWSIETEATKALGDLVVGQPVTLHFGGRRMDRYGRLLAQAAMTRSGEAVWVQGRLVASGMARAAPIAGSETCLADLLRHEEAARAARLGLWQAPAYRIRDASRPEELIGLGPSFHIFEGRVASVGNGLSHVYLNFGSDRRRDLSVSIARKDAAVLAGDGSAAPRNLSGALVRLRGWVGFAAGPSIEAVTAVQIQRIDALTIKAPRRPWPRLSARP